MSAIYHEGSWLGNATDPEVLVKDTVGWTGKNLLKNTARTVTKNGVTMTVNADKSVTFNGTPTARTDFYITSEIDNYANTLDANLIGEKVITSIGTNVTFNVYEFGVHLIDSSKNRIMSANMDIPNGKEESSIVTIPSNAVYYDAYFVIDRGGSHTPLNNVTFYPMLRKARITDPTYEPYHESVEVMYEEEIHGVNLLENKATTQTIDGVTFTVNSDKTVSTSGTASANILFWLTQNLKNKLEVGTKYRLSGCPIGGDGETYRMDLRGINSGGGSDPLFVDKGNGIEYTYTSAMESYSAIGVLVRIVSGQNVSGKVFTPMLRKADIEDSTYRPYNPQAIQNQLNAQGVLGAKNLLNHVLTSRTSDGVTIDVDDKKIITLNGTSTSDFIVTLLPKEDLNALLTKYGNLILNGSDPVKYTDARIITKSGSYIIDNGTGILLDASKTYENNLSLQIFNGKTFNNLKIKPMLRLASDPDDTYQPYTMTNRELTEEKINIADLKTVVSASSDFADFKTRIASL